MTPRSALHVTNGDIAAEALRRAGIAQDIVAWRDVLHEGPVPGRMGPAQLRDTRARFIAERGWGAYDSVRAGFEERDSRLADLSARPEVVLWFEHDLYDQLQLLQVLRILGLTDLGDTRLTMFCEARHLGDASAEDFRAGFDARADVTDEQLDAAAFAWGAFSGPDPRKLEAVVDDGMPPLPFVAAAAKRLLEELPWVAGGLSRTERQALEALAGGPAAAAAVFAASQAREEAVFMGDTVFAWYLERLSAVPVPLVVRADGVAIESPKDADAAREFWATDLRLTDAGREVLSGAMDHIALNSPARWLGGMHLTERTSWRWDGQRRCVAG